MKTRRGVAGSRPAVLVAVLLAFVAHVSNAAAAAVESGPTTAGAVDGAAPKTAVEAAAEGRGHFKNMMMNPYMLIPQLITLGFAPIVLANLKMLVMNALMINNMALNAAIFMTVRNLVFGPRPKVKYVNHGYSNGHHHHHHQHRDDVPHHLDDGHQHHYRDAQQQQQPQEQQLSEYDAQVAEYRRRRTDVVGS